MKWILISAFTISLLLHTNRVSASQCKEDVGTFHQIKENYYNNKNKDALAVKCMAYAGDDRAATLYAEHLLEQFNKSGDRSEAIEAYAWYRLSIERAKTVADWMQMIQILELEFPGIKSESEDIFVAIKQQVKPRKRFNKKFNVVVKKDEPKVDPRRTYVGSRIPIAKRKFTPGNIRAATSGSMDTEGGISAGGGYEMIPLTESETKDRKEDSSEEGKN